MAFTTGTAIDLEGLIAAISTFVTANGWVENRRDNVNGIIGWSKNSVFVSGRWEVGGPPAALSLHQATVLLPASGTEPGDATGDSGNGFNTSSSHANASLRLERFVELGDGPFPHYAIFENDSGPTYVHIVVETSTDIFVHFGFGELNKAGDGWTGGEYLYGNTHDSGTELATTSNWLLDGLAQSVVSTDERQQATMRITGMPNQPGGTIWGNVWGNSRTDGVQPDDSAANAKVAIQGGFRGGPFATPWGVFSADKTRGLIPMYSIACFYFDNTNNHAYFLGWQADVRGVNIRSIAPKEEIVIGSDTWVVYPARQRDIGGGVATTAFNGIAYKQVSA
jgi:hypothetical protein